MLGLHAPSSRRCSTAHADFRHYPVSHLQRRLPVRPRGCRHGGLDCRPHRSQGADRPTTRAVPYRPTFVGGLLIKQVVPETTRRFPSPKIFKPADSSAIHDALGIFLNQQDEFVSFVRQSEGIDYNRARLRSPVTPLMRYSLADAFVVTIVHESRHLAQAARVRAMPSFPN